MSEAPDAVLWDMDGTIVDTEPYWMAAERDLVASYGGEWTYEDGLKLVGKGLEDAAEILQQAGVHRDIDDIVQTLTDRVTVALRQDPAILRPGAAELLRELRERGIRTALVTMSLRRMADAVIDQLGFDAFDVIVTGEVSRRPKPYPDPYLQAAEMLDVPIEHTLVLEDSPGGLRSGVASGAVTLGIPHLVPLDGFGADAVWPTLEGRTSADLFKLFAARRPSGVSGRAR